MTLPQRSYPRELKVIFLSVFLAILSYATIIKTDILNTSKNDGVLDQPQKLSLEAPPLHSVNTTSAKPLPLPASASPGGETISEPMTNSTISDKKFYIISIPETTTKLVGSNTQAKAASAYYKRSLNEESAEVWLHRGFERLPQRTMDPKEADVFVVVGYFHLYTGMRNHRKKVQLWKQFVPLYREQFVDASKPHLILIPSWNPQVSREVGIHSLVNMIQGTDTQTSQRKPGKVWSVGFERNPKWQNLPPSRIIPIPYVVSGEHDSPNATHQSRVDNSVFYAGDARKNAEAWAGCFRSKIVSAMKQQHLPQSLQLDVTSNSTNSLVNVQLLGKKDRMEQATYNSYMTGSDWCLILCGDTPSSRTLTSSMIFGCIPVRVGSRLRGFCEEPCHKGFGWDVTGARYPHLPYTEKIDWNEFPEIHEHGLLNSTKRDMLERLFAKYKWEEKERLRSTMHSVRKGWIYGFGDPVTSPNASLGGASRFIWESFVDALRKEETEQ